MTTATIPTADEIRAQITQHREAITEAEREIGAAALDGQSTKAAEKRMQDARDGIARCEAALQELDRRGDDAQERAEAAVRANSYRWAVAFLTRAEAVLEAYGPLLEASARLQELGSDPLVRRSQVRHTTPDGLDELVRALPKAELLRAVARLHPQRTRLGAAVTLQDVFTVERLRELREQFEALAACEVDAS